MQKPLSELFAITEADEPPDISAVLPELTAQIQGLAKEGTPLTVDRVQNGILRKMVCDQLQSRSDLEDRLTDLMDEQRTQQRSFLLNLLKVADSLDRLIRNLDPANEVAGSLQSTRSQLLDILEDQEVETIPISIGKPFDPSTCEVSSRQERDDLAAETILAIDRKGYTWQNKTLRRARVIVSIQPEEQNNG
jgi:molecular chaperone GrpE (heat shock protein)